MLLLLQPLLLQLLLLQGVLELGLCKYGEAGWEGYRCKGLVFGVHPKVM
jgi:hypothetical protein